MKLSKYDVVLNIMDYEELIREAEQGRIMKSCLQNKPRTPEEFYRCICGLQMDRVPTPEPGGIGIMIEDVEEPNQSDVALDEVSVTPIIDEAQENDSRKGRRKIDRGKVMALHTAGWNNVKIAEEMGCSACSVGMIIKEEKQ